MEHLRASVETFYATGDPAAHQVLLEFHKSPQAWSVASQLLFLPQQSMQHFGAQTLYRKVAEEWRSLSNEQRHEMRKSLIAHIRQLITGGNPSPGVAERLAAAVATISVRTSGGVTTVVGEVTSMRPLLAMQVLAAIPDECSKAVMSHERSVEADREILAARAHVFGLVQQCLRHEGDAALHASALACALAWTSRRTTLRELFEHAGNVLETLMATALRSQSHATIVSVCEVLEEALSCSENAPMSDETETHARAVEMTAHFLVRLTPIFRLATNVGDADPARNEANVCLCKAICRLSSAFGSCAMDFVARGSDVALDVVRLHVACTGHSHQSVVHEALSFWDELQVLPMENRHEMLRKPVFRELVPVLLRRCACPREIDAEDRFDEFSFTQFRGELREFLQSSFYVLQEDYVVVLHACLAASLHELQQYHHRHQAGGGPEEEEPWRAFEVVVFGAQGVARTLQNTYDAKTNSALLERTDAFLMELFGVLFGISAHRLPRHSVVIESSCRVVAAYHSWLSRRGTLLQRAVAFLVSHAATRCTLHDRWRSSRFGWSWGAQARRSYLTVLPSAAGPAFLSCCASWSGMISRNVTALRQMIRYVSSIAHSRDVNIVTKRLLTEGLGVVVASLGDSRSMVSCLSDLLEPIVKGIQRQDAQLRDHLLMLSSAILSLRDADKEVLTQPLLRALHAVWSLLSDVAARHSQSQDVMETLCGVFDACVKCLEEDALPLIPSLCEIVVLSLQRTASASAAAQCIEVLAAAVDMCGQSATEPIRAAMRSVIELTMARLHALGGEQIKALPEIMHRFFELATSVMHNCPLVLVEDSHLPLLLKLAVAAIAPGQCTEHETVEAVLRFLESVVMFVRQHPVDNPVRRAVEAHVAEVSPHAVQAIVFGLAFSLPLMLLRSPLAITLLSFFQAAPHLSLQAVQAALASEAMATHCPRLSDEDRQRLQQALWAMRDAPKRRFACVCRDFADICRDEQTVDALAAYL